MKKKIFIPVIAFTTFLSVGALASFAGSRMYSAKAAHGNSAADWVVANGDAAQLSATDITDGVRIGNLYANSADMCTKEKVTLDGLSVTLTMSVEGQANGALYFSQSEGFAWTGAVFSIWSSLYPGQSRFVVTDNHDFNHQAHAYATKDRNGATGFGIDRSMVMNDLTEDAVNLTFTHVSSSWWQLDIKETDTGHFWDGQFNTTTDEAGLKTITTYIHNTDLKVDENGQAFMHIASGTGGAIVDVTDFTDGTFKEVPEDIATESDVATMKDMINAYTDDTYPESLKETVNTAREAALEACVAGMKMSELDAVYNDFTASLKAHVLEYFGYSEITESDPGASAYACWGMPNVFKRLNDVGGVLVDCAVDWGNRSEFFRQFDLTNNAMSINLAALSVGQALMVNFSSMAQSFITEPAEPSEPGYTYYHVEFYKTSEINYLCVFGNTKDHNVSITEWAQDTSGAYNGRNIVSPSGTINFEVSTDFNSNKSVVTVDEKTMEIDSSILYDQTTPTQDVPAYVTLAVINGSGRAQFVVDSVFDASAREYYDSLATEVAANLANIEEVKTTLLANVGEQGLTDANFKTYTEALELAVSDMAQTELMQYDFNKYVGEAFNKAVEEITAPVIAYTAKVDAAQQEAISYISTHYKTEDYREEQVALLEAAIAAALESLEATQTLGDVKTVIEAFDEAVAAIPTDADLVLAEAKVLAKDEITAYLNLEDYSDLGMELITTIINEGKKAIDEATSLDNLATTVQTIKARLDEVLTAEEEAVVAAALAEAKTDAIDELKVYVDPNNYRKAEQEKIAEILERATREINACESIEQVLSLLDSFKAELSGLKTKPAGGCQGSIIGSSIIVSISALLGAGLLLLKKKRD